jgi:putative NIF3 family GTP cyclohydrolase 1 type 2
MEKICPLSLAESSWDNVGLLLEAPNQRAQATKVFLTIDLTREVLDECLADPQIGVIVSYHPPIFRAFKRLLMSDEKQSIALKCAAAGVSIFSPHTALDSCTGGINDWLARGLGQGQTFPITANPNPPVGQELCGQGRIHSLDEPVPLAEIVKRVKSYLKLSHCKAFLWRWGHNYGRFFDIH